MLPVLTEGTFLSAFIALIPILWLLASLGIYKMPAYKACTIGLILGILIAIFVWRMPYNLVLLAALEGIVLALMPILWVILAAIFLYNISLKTGAMDKIKHLMSNLSGDRRVQVLIIAWGFGGFLEATAGFGTAVAIPASILIALGFDAFFAAILCLIANTIAVAFGGVGLPVTTLAKVTDLSVMQLTFDVALQLSPFVLLVPFLLVFTITKSVRAFYGVWTATITAALSFAITQLAVARFIGPELTAILGSIAAIVSTVIAVKLSPPAEEWRFPDEAAQPEVITSSAQVGTFKENLIAWIPYILLLALVLVTSNLIPSINIPLSKLRSDLLIYPGPGSKAFYIEWFLTPGTLIMISAIIGGLCQGASVRTLATILGSTVVQLQKTFITVLAIVSMAKVLGYSGMIGSVAVALASATGKTYPVFAPLIGALGTFITGSDTSSNVLFGALQKQTAVKIGSNLTWITAANTSGACAGKLISPQSIAIATSATGLIGREGDILNITFKYLLLFIVGLGLISYWFAY